mmetsp:Transcript_31250/g.67331  ORF Transcript_31250/g.67331 Transcript_31250/m.67331 type:complete len:842 (-) Transcript_31250:276-2801(-)
MQTGRVAQRAGVSTKRKTGARPVSTTMSAQQRWSVDGRCLRAGGGTARPPVIDDFPSSISVEQVQCADPLGPSSRGGAGPRTLSALFLSIQGREPAETHTLRLGKVFSRRLVSLPRFKLWWMFPEQGSTAGDVPPETQLLLIDRSGPGPGEEEYVALLPLSKGSFRSMLSGGSTAEPGSSGDGGGDHHLWLSMNTGSSKCQLDCWDSALCLAVAPDPFEAIRSVVANAANASPGFRTRYHKAVPEAANLFGWCTWDAFYHKVSPGGIMRGLEAFEKGGVIPKFLIIDDGWQTVRRRIPFSSAATRFLADKVMQWVPATLKDFVSKHAPWLYASLCLLSSAAHFCYRLGSIHANVKFSGFDRGDALASCFVEDERRGFKGVVAAIRARFDVRKIFCWHAMAGYWGGLSDETAGLRKYAPAITKWRLQPSIVAAEPALRHDALTVNGVGIVPPDKVASFHGDMHAYLSGCGIDGVKVDVQSAIGPHGEAFGGATRLTRAYHDSLEESVRRHFDGDCIACMCHSSDDLLHLRTTNICRASDDFFPDEEASHGAHIMAVAFNSLLIGEIAVPDWDMFWSYHKHAKLHAAARAVSGGPLYLSDVPGFTDFDLLRALVLADGTILRARLAGRPTRDCLFASPLQDGRTVLKVWNNNDFGGVIGAFNVQGSRWNKARQKFYKAGIEKPNTVSIAPKDAELPQGSTSGEEGGGTDRFLVWSYRQKRLSEQAWGESEEHLIQPMDFDVFTVVPIIESGGVQCAPLGLVESMMNGAAIIESVAMAPAGSGGGASAGVEARLRIRPASDRRTFLLWAKSRPKRAGVAFQYEEATGICRVSLTGREEELTFEW